LGAVADPVGPGNARAVALALAGAGTGGVVVAAWGGWRARELPVDAATHRVLAMVRRRELRLVALARNRDGSPRHPLYVARHSRYSDLE
jgi:hypothetical protein